jgi:quercetin dioxygenase-like cupin family protein
MTGDRPTVTEDDALLRQLGSAIRLRRRHLGRTLVDVAGRAGLSHPFLSQIERGLARPSMRSLTAVAAALDTTAQALLALPEQPARVATVRSTDPLPVVDSPGGTVRSLARGEHAMLPLEFTGAPGEFEEYFTHVGEEFLYVAEGTIEVDLDGELSILGDRDSVYYGGGVRHRWRRVGPGPVRVILVQQNLAPPAVIAAETPS